MEMEANPMRLSLILGLFIVSTVSAAVLKAPGRDEVARYRSEVMELGARLSSLEKEIGSKNNLYISSIGQIKQFEADISLYRSKLTELQTQVQRSQKENKKILQSYMAQCDNDSSEAWERRVHFELLKQAQIKLKSNETELASFQAKVTDFDQKLASLKSTEEELAQMIRELETRKKATMEQYLTKVEYKKKAESKAHQVELQKKLNVVKKQFSEAPVIAKRPDRTFGKPVDDFLTYTASPKGVTFKYRAVQPVKAAGNGKVVYAGDLASYGQVVLIDHGDDLRTVLLGKMNIRVKKNDTVKDGDVLGYTTIEGSEAENLYFEVRKKNTAQNTILWLDPNGVSKI
jgi:septal ring factor EnvC (AmiA/AmiB activator)